MRYPLVSIIIPAYNARNYLPDAVSSALSQTYPQIEVIIVDDGSVDTTLQIANSLAKQDARIQVIHKINEGPSSARNAALRIAKGEYICFLDADDTFLPDKIEKQLLFLEQHSEYDLVYSDHYDTDSDLNPIALVARGLPPVSFDKLYIYRNWFSPIDPLLKMALITKVGLFDESLSGPEDWDYWIRCAQQGKFAYLPGVLANYRHHPQQSHRQLDKMRYAQYQVILKHYKSDNRKFRSALSAMSLFYAKNFKSLGKYFNMLRELLLFTLQAGSLTEMRLIIDLLD
jgi:teichuronic acid biosynthesis glycosyltransferase TuaG